MLKYHEIKKALSDKKLLGDVLIAAVISTPLLASAILRLNSEAVLRREAEAHYINYRHERRNTEDEMEKGITLEEKLNGSVPSKVMQKKLDSINDSVFMHEKRSMFEKEKYLKALSDLRKL